MSHLSNKLQLSNPLLAGTTLSTKADSSSTLATKRKASSDSQAQRSIPSKQKTGGMNLRGSGSLLLGSSLLGHGASDGKAKKASGLQTSLLGVKSPLMENKLLSSSSSASLTLHNRLLGSSGRSGFSQCLTSSSKPLTSGTHPHQASSTPMVSSTQGALQASRTSGSSLLGKHKHHGPSESNRSTSISKKVKTQSHKRDQAQDVVIDSSVTTCTLPEYNFSREVQAEKLDPWASAPSFDKLDEVAELKTEVRSRSQIAVKQQFINAVSASLIGGPNFHQRDDATRKSIRGQAGAIISNDPEFILKVALYTRKQLNIRTTANFLLALAAMTPDCRPFLRKYFSASISLPSDWIDVAELYQTFHDKNINYGSLPSALRKAMVDRFPKFDQYQLAKYNKDKKKKKPPTPAPAAQEEGQKPVQRQKSDEGDSGDDDNDKDDDDDSERDSDTDEEELERLSFTLKQLVRKLHITGPVDSVMCLLGKKYPEDLESFYKSRLPGTWDPEKAGKRMKLPTPETWETQVSLKGNKAAVWEQLIDNKKLPFMAMLRNLRNMISAGISEKHHKWVLYKLTDRGSVVYSKQFPFRFFSAYEVLKDMEKEVEKSNYLKETGKMPDPPAGRGRGRGGARGRGAGRGRGRGGRGGGQSQMPQWKLKKLEKKLSELPYDSNLLNRYRKALDSAVKIATSYNVKPIPGKTLLLCNLGMSMGIPCSSARGLGPRRTVKEVGVLLGLMCKYSCEDCTMIIYTASGVHRTVQLESGTILDNMGSVLDLASSLEADFSPEMDPTILGEILRDRTELDNLVILSNGDNQAGDEARMISEFLSKYRHVVNKNLLYVNVNLSGARCSMSSSATPSHPNDIFIAGYSDQILRFIAERGDTGQVTHVDNIDKAFGLDDIKIRTGKKAAVVKAMPEKPLALAAPLQTRRHVTLRVFISSTFRDMHGERDLLTRFVFPELRAKARSRFVNIYEVDLRWGVNEEQTRHSSSVEICLREANRCNIFLGMLGDRYGYVPESYPDMSDDEDFDWLSSHPRGRSITELEMYHKALKNSDSDGKAFFYIRNSDFIEGLPNKLRSQFVDDNEQLKERLANLKQTIRTSGYEVFDGYPCQFGGIAEGKPVVVSLEEFGRRVINNVWNYIERTYPIDGEVLDEVSHERAQHAMFLQTQLATFTGRRNQLKQCLEAVGGLESGLVLITGKQGCGKTALLASVADTLQKKAKDSPIITHFVGAVPGSAHIAPLLRRLCHELGRSFELDKTVPQEYKNLISEFPHFLEQAATHVDSSNKLLIFIDGVSNMDKAHQAHNLDWLPQNIPQNVVFVLSAVSSTPAHAAAVRRQATMVEVGPLDLLDKAEVVRRTLAAHHKTLNESPFNNQMKLLVSKREANLPLFLRLACEELRVFGVFEEVSDRLKAMSHTISSLLQEVLKRLEDDHGRDLISTALALLVSTRDGVYEEDLHRLLSLHTLLSGSKYTYAHVVNARPGPEGMLPQAVMARLVRGIKSLLAPTGEHSDSRLKVSHGQISNAIVQRYMTGAASELQIRTHALLAGYFTVLAKAVGTPSSPWTTTYVHSLTELPYHLVQAGLFNDLLTVLTDPFFIHAKCLAGLAASLLEDFQAETSSTSKAVLREREKFLANPLLLGLRSFVSRHLHILALCPGLLWQQAMNEPEDSPVRRAVIAQGACNGKSFVAWKNKRETEDECSMTLTGFAQAVLCVAIAPGDQYFAVGTKDCQLKLFELATGKELKTFVGHADAVTSCCFVGRSRLVSACRDGKLSLWDVEQGHRVTILKGHNGMVSGCVSDTKGVNVASCAWDCRVLVWDGRSGKQTCDITETRPVGCLAYHPEGKLLVTGSWDATLKIWDTFNKKRVAILRGHKSSIRAVTYSPSGRHIASASLDGSVKLWSADTGTQVGSLCGHSQPINCITFSKTGRELVTVSNDHKIKIWSGNLGKQLATIKGNNDNTASTQAVFSSDGELVAVGYHSGEVKVIEVASKQELFSYQGKESRVKGLAWCDVPGSEDENLLVGFENGHAEILNNVTERLSTVQLQANHSPVTCVTFAPSTQTAAICYENMSVAFWHKPTSPGADRQKNGVPPTSVIHPKCNGVITCCDFNSAGNRLVLGTRDAWLFVYNVKDGKVTSKEPVLALNNCHKDWINSCAWSSKTDFVATASNDSTVKLWDMKTGKEKAQLKGHQAAVYSVAFSHGCIVSGCLDSSVKVWSHRGVEITTLYGHSQKVNRVDIYVPTADEDEDKVNFDGDENEADSAGGAGSWGTMVAEDEWKDRHQQRKLDKVSEVKLEDVIIASASDDGTTQIWKPLQANELTTLIGHSDRVLGVAMATNGQVITTSMDCSVKVWNPQLTPGAVQLGAHDDEVVTVVSSTKTNFALSTSRNGKVCLWRVADSNNTDASALSLVYSWKAEECAINAACFIGKHMSFLLGGDDGSIGWWKIQEVKGRPGAFTTEKIKIRKSSTTAFSAMPSPITCMAYNEQHDTLYAGTWSGVVTLNNLTVGKHKLSTSKMSDWVLDLQLTKGNGVAASLANGTVVFCKKGSQRTMDVGAQSGAATTPPWQYASTIAPPEMGPIADGGCVLTGNSHGALIMVKEDRVVPGVKQLKAPVTGLGVSQHHLVSSSADGTVKFWEKQDCIKQVGQFFCPSPVTAMCTMSETSNRVMCGDQLGNVYLLEWQQ